MDPITIMAAATAAFNGVKKAVELGREVSDIYSQLSTWAGHVGDFHNAVAQITLAEKKKPGIFDKIKFNKSETAEAFDMFAAKQKIIERICCNGRSVCCFFKQWRIGYFKFYIREIEKLCEQQSNDGCTR